MLSEKKQNLFGRKDDDIEPFGGFHELFEIINNHIGKSMSSDPKQVQINFIIHMYEEQMRDSLFFHYKNQSTLGNKDDDTDSFSRFKGFSINLAKDKSSTESR